MKNLHLRFKELGKERNKLTYRLLNMLPEIYESGIWKKYAGSIVEYAGKYAGLSGGVVKKRLNLEKLLEGKDQLKKAIAEVGVHKVAMVASITNEQNEVNMVSLLKTMSKNAVQEMAKELRQGNPRGEAQTCKAVAKTLTLELDEEMTFLFLKFKKKFPKLSNKEVMRELLKQVEEPIKQKSFAIKPKAPKLIPGDEFAKSRYVPAAIKRQAIGTGKCHYSNCNKPYDVLHHAEYYAHTRKHKKLIPLCKEHHEFIHNGLITYDRQIDTNKRNINIYDEMYLGYRGQ